MSQCTSQPTVAEPRYTDAAGRTHRLLVAPGKGSDGRVNLFYEEKSDNDDRAAVKRTYVTAECIRSNDGWHRRGVWSALRAMARRAQRKEKRTEFGRSIMSLDPTTRDGDLFANACSILARLFSVVQMSVAQRDLSALATLLPYAVSFPTTPKGALAFFRVGDRAFTLYPFDGDRNGAFGMVFSGFYERKDGSHQPVVVKFTDDGLITRSAQELVLQVCAWCASRRASVHEPTAGSSRSHGDKRGAKVARVIFGALVASSDDVLAPYSVMIGMEQLDMRLSDWLVAPSRTWREIVACLIDIAVLIERLQRRIEFMHRDLHCENIMMRGDTAHMIDFGYARCALKLPKQSRRSVLYTPWYDDQEDQYDRGFDLMMLMLSLIELSRDEDADTSALEQALGVLTTVMSPLRRELDSLKPRSKRFQKFFEAYYNGRHNRYGRHRGQRPKGKAHAVDGIRLKSDMPLHWLSLEAGLGLRYRPCYPEKFVATARRALERK